jgi:hypothetical protein
MATNRSRSAKLLLLGALALCLPGRARAQAVGSISGVVTDSQGSPVSGITIRAVDALDPNKYFSAVSDEAGNFTVSRVPVGSYNVIPRTAGTNWMLKDALPLIDVRASQPTNVGITLIEMRESAPAYGRYVTGQQTLGANTVQMGYLALAGVAAAASIANIFQINDLEDDIDGINNRLDLHDDEFRLFVDDFQSFTNDFHDFENDFNRFLQDFADHQDQLDQLADDFDDFRRDFFDFRRDFDDFAASPLARR